MYWEISSIYTFVVSMILIINILLAIVIVFIEKRDIGSTWAWLMVLFFLPILGFFVYLFLGRQLKDKNFYKIPNKELTSLQSAVHEQIDQLKSGYFYHNDLLKKYSDLILLNLSSANSLLTMKNDIVILSEGNGKFNELFKDIRAAKKEINLQYYIIQRDQLGLKLRDELTKKAKEGIKVRILYDEIGSRKISLSFFKELILNGGEVEVFFPSFLKLINFRINNRNHRKVCIIDGEIAYIGGFNIGNDYLGINKKYGFWRDTHLKITGESVNHIQWGFVLDWCKATNQQEIKYEQQLSVPSEKNNGMSPVQIISSGPNSETEHLKNMFVKLIISAKKSVYIQSPYFIPDSSFMDACKISLLAGIDVRIMLPKMDKKTLVNSATGSYIGELLTYGAKILLYQKGYLHAKTMIVDHEIASVGSTNIDIRSFKLNFEVNAIVYDKKVANELENLFMEDSQMCSELSKETYSDQSLINKGKEAISRLFSPIL